MDNKKTIALLCLSIVIVIIATASVTYAYLSVGDVQEHTNVLNSACFNVTFNEENLINFTGYPMSSSTGLNLTPYKITVTNTCDVATKYKILLNVMNDSSTTLLPFINYSKDGVSFDKLQTLDTFTIPQELIVGNNNIRTSYILYDDEELGATPASKTHSFKLWIDEEAKNDIMGESFKAQVSVYSGDVPIS